VSVTHQQLEAILQRTKTLRKDMKAETNTRVFKKGLRDEAAALGSDWHKNYASFLKHSLSSQLIDKYGALYTRLLQLSVAGSQRAAYLETIEAIIKPFNDDVMIPSQQGALGAAAPSSFDTFFGGLSNADESEYLKEAIACAKAGHHRAAVVLGWSAAIDRIHRVIEQKGFMAFNNMSQQMAAAATGRYKKFNKPQNVSSLAEMREVFDSIILWVTEAMGMIDTNQHTRLSGCFDMRCHGAHPGDAPITPYNLMSFFSDLDQIVFMNPAFKFDLAPSASKG
jgi:hypothetical protein